MLLSYLGWSSIKSKWKFYDADFPVPEDLEREGGSCYTECCFVHQVKCRVILKCVTGSTQNSWEINESCAARHSSKRRRHFAVLSFSHRCIFGANSALEIIKRKMPEARQDLEWLVIYYPCVQSPWEKHVKSSSIEWGWGRASKACWELPAVTETTRFPYKGMGMCPAPGGVQLIKNSGGLLLSEWFSDYRINFFKVVQLLNSLRTWESLEPVQTAYNRGKALVF